MTSSQDDLDLQILESIHTHSAEGSALATSIRDDVGYEPLRTTIGSLIDRGLVRDAGRGAYDLTPDGRREVGAMLARRQDRGLRRRLCRDRLLAWVDSRGASNAGKRVSRSEFDAAPDLLPFTDEESAAAADYLRQQGLIETLGAAGGKHILLWTTDLGQECIDEGGDVAAFTKRASAPSGGQVFNIYGSGNNVAAALGDDNEVTVSLSTFDHDRAIEFAAAVRDAVPSLTQHGIDAAEVERYAAEIEQRQDLTRAQKATALLHRMIESTTTGTLGGVLATLGAGALGIA